MEETAKQEWYSIVEGQHSLWTGISEPYKETIRAFLIYFHSQILINASEKFKWSRGSIGNFFFTGSRLFFNSLEAAIFWFSRISGIDPNTKVLPVINKNQRLTIGVTLKNGDRILGQNRISHPPSDPSSTAVNKMDMTPLSAPIVRVFYLNEDKQVTLPAVNPMVLQMLSQQEVIIYSMGSLYTRFPLCFFFFGSLLLMK